MNTKVSVGALLALVAAGAAFTGAAATAAEQIAHRREVRAAIDGQATHASAVEAALKDTDASVRRYALVKRAEDLGGDQAALQALGKAFASDASPDVRILAKALSRKGGLFRLNEPMSLSPLNDHETIRIQTAKRTGGTYRFAAPLPAHDAVELWFGRPNCDLHVWVNGVYVGQFDNDLSRGQEFRLDVTKETKTDGENVVVIRDPAGKEIEAGFSAEALKW